MCEKSVRETRVLCAIGLWFQYTVMIVPYPLNAEQAERA